MSLVAFDFDGTLTDDEMVVLLAERAGVAGEVAEVTERAMNGELAYAESLRRRVDLLSALPESEVHAAYEEVALRPGTADLLRALSDAGVATAVLTGGFERCVSRVLEAADAPVDHLVANSLPFAETDADSGAAEPCLTGAVAGPLVEGTKDDALADLAETVGVDVAATVAVGDGANDLPMLEAAGLAVGFRPKPAVRPACDVVVETMAGLESVLADEGVL